MKLSKNGLNRTYVSGRRDLVLHNDIIEWHRQHPNATFTDIARANRCNIKTVIKVISRHHGTIGLPKYGRPKGWRKMSVASRFVVRYLVNNNHVHSAKHLRQLFFAATGHELEIKSDNTLRHELRSMGLGKKLGKFEHPNKFKPQNQTYYQDFLLVRRTTSPLDQYFWCFGDEVQVQKNNQGRLAIWSSSNLCRIHFKKNESVESHTIIGFLSLLVTPPIIFKVVQGASNGRIYHEFVVKEVLPKLKQGQVMFVDNLNYHVMGQLAESTVKQCHEKGVKYIRLPTYSPELNPIEMVWAWMKQRLSKTPVSAPLIDTVCQILNSLSHQKVENFYSKCGYLFQCNDDDEHQ